MLWNPQSSYEHYLVTKLARAEFQHDRAACPPKPWRRRERLQHSMIDLGYKSLDEHSAAHRNMDRHQSNIIRGSPRHHSS